VSAEGVVLAESIPEEAFGARGGTGNGGNRHGRGIGRKEKEGGDEGMYTGDRGGKGVIV